MSEKELRVADEQLLRYERNQVETELRTRRDCGAWKGDTSKRQVKSCHIRGSLLTKDAQEKNRHRNISVLRHFESGSFHWWTTDHVEKHCRKRKLSAPDVFNL